MDLLVQIQERLRKVNDILKEFPVLKNLEDIEKALEIIEFVHKELKVIGCYLSVKEQLKGFKHDSSISNDNK